MDFSLTTTKPAKMFEGGSVRIAVVSGLSNAAKVLDLVKHGKVNYDLIEVMA